jgi:hypothetical protein
MRVLLALTLLAATAGMQDPSTVYKPGDGVSLPQVTKQVKAEYTQEATANRIEGKVGLDEHEGRQAGRRPHCRGGQLHAALNQGRGRTIVMNDSSRSPAFASTFQHPAVGNVNAIV